MSTDLRDLHEALVEYGFRNFVTHDPEFIARNGIRYWVSLDTDSLRETDRRRELIDDEIGIPNRVTWNGETHRFTLRVDSIRERVSMHILDNRTQIHGRSYSHEYCFERADIARVLAENNLKWIDSKIADCNECGLRCPSSLPTKGLVAADGDGDSEQVCVRCALAEIGESDILDGIESGIAERVVADRSGMSSGRLKRVPNALYGHKTELKEAFRDGDVPLWTYNNVDDWKWSARRREWKDAKRRAGNTPYGNTAAVFRVAVDEDETFHSGNLRKRTKTQPATVPDGIAERCRKFAEAEGRRAGKWWFVVELGPRGGVDDLCVVAEF